ncbi:MAG: pullulanase-type alpha-1,6-glucosidase [Anaerolineales bacterium]
MKRLFPLLILLLTFSPFLLFSPAQAQELPPEGLPVPQIVAIAGSFQDDLGCPGEWNTDCERTFLALDGNSLVWRGSFQIPAGSHEYKVALNGSWTDNFGLGGEYYGPNIPLELEEASLVTFYYSHETHFVTDDVNSIIANVPGSFQDEIGCSADWAPDCLRSWLQDPDGDGLYTWSTTWIPAGNYEAKVAVGGSWTENYGADGAQDGPNIPFTVGEFEQVTFTWDSTSKQMTIETAPAPEGAPTSPPVYTVSSEKPQPATVTIPGTIQSVLGCPGDWQPDCANTFLTFDEVDRIWQGEWTLPAGDYEYKVALNGTWDVNFGLNAAQNGPNIPLSVPADQPVKFYYDHQTGWVTDNINSLIPVVVGSFQAALGCATDNDPTCLRSWLEDPNGDGIYDRLIEGIPVGEYTARVALGETEIGDPAAYATEETTFTIAEEGSVVFMAFDAATNELKIQAGAPKGDLTRQQAHWVTEDTLAWNIDTDVATTFSLISAPDGGLELDPSGVIGGTSINLTLAPEGLPEEVKAKFPHLSQFAALKLAPADLEKVPDLLKGQLAVAAFNADGRPVDATGVQIPGVLDALYTYDGPLGLTWEEGLPVFRVWAPTARSVTLNIYANSGERTFPQARPMTLDPETGVWAFTGEAAFKGKYYAYEVVVFVPSTGQVETNIVTDPYSVGLSTNGFRSLVVDLNDPELAPEGWDTFTLPPLAAPEDIVIYEMHIRDFSVNDLTVPEEWRGTYKAFTVLESNGMKHLAQLAQAGLTHLHLLPVFDIASVNEDKTTWPAFNFEELAALPPDSEEQQALIAATKTTDAFNWGYDPVHYGVPDGSYATNPEDATRILEFREMVQALNQTGLRVVMDVVYNHTNASGQRPNSVLDRIVPGYYHRLNANGQVETSTCCQNTATEHNMMRKLMIDTLITWATEYNISGFRFDLMGHHMVSDMIAVRDALHAIDPTIYIYGEGWDFGEVAGGARGGNATQLNLAGTGIGTFNDRVRDSVRGGSPFGDYLKQGFATGLYTDPNETMNGDAVDQIQLLLFADRIRAALAGNLAAFTFTGADGTPVTGAEVDYNGSPTGYTQDPQEHIVYISAHDNEIWFDAVQYKAPAEATLEDRVRMVNLGNSLVMFSQGIPFFTAGDDMLRSKSFDKDSYDSGDWFNRLDFTYTDNGFGSGLPIADKNQDNWPLQAPLLGNPDLKPTQENILAAVAHFREILQIRKSSPLFRLQTADEINARLTFQNTGPDQIPGLIVMTLADEDDKGVPAGDLDPNYDRIVVLFNAAPDEISFAIPEAAGLEFALHPVLAASADPVVQTAAYDAATGTFTVPGRTTAVFVLDEIPVQLELPTAEPVPTKVATPTSEPTPALSEETETPMNTYIIGALIGLIVVFGWAAWARLQRGKK